MNETYGDVRIVDRPGRDMLGEGPVWSARHHALFWVDIVGPALHRLSLATGAISSWTMPEPIGWAIEREGGNGLIAGLKSGFHHLSLDPFVLERIGTPEPDRPANRLNDAKVDPHGRIWAGTKADEDVGASGALYRLDPDLTWSRMDDGYVVTNGPTFSPDGSVMYHTDSGTRSVHAFTLHDDGRLTDKRLFLRFEDGWGYPDGMTTDAQGGIWIAHWGGGRISRFHPDGRLDRSITMPATNITSLCFAGADLDRLFVTSARMECEHEPLAGALFELAVGHRGWPMPRFAG